MRYLLVILVLFVSSAVYAAPPDSMSLATSVADLNSALINKDTVKLKRLLNEDVHYYHSNGWMESKREVIRDLYNGVLVYNQIDVQSQTIKVVGNMGQAKMIIDIDIVMRGRPIQMKLNVYQHWVWINNEWKLVARKSQKV